jgi:two-component system, NtrC family, response regulator HydG
MLRARSRLLARILLVDDEANIRRILGSVLRDDGHEIVEARTVGESLLALRAGIYDLVITDQKMPDGEGLQIVDSCRDIDPALPVVMLTAFATIELAVEAMRRGTFDFITKPFQPDQVRAVVRRATERAALVRENEALRMQIGRLGGTARLIGNSPAIEQVRSLIERVGRTSATVLITGETGSGKELVARELHAQSARAAKAFVAVNCAGLTETLLESELFGHERGAFTGADRARQGFFEAAHRGTLFLDEAAEMSLSLQAKLLRVLVDGVLTRVGSTTPRTVDVRIVAATHRDLRERVAQGLFREDLFYRLAVVPIAVPALRERAEDIELLARHFLAEIGRQSRSCARAISPDAIEKLRCYPFPGNVRELRNLIERATILARGECLEASDFPELDLPRPPLASEARSKMDLKLGLLDLERDMILRALEMSGGVQAEAARRLGISRSDIGYKIRKHAIDVATK